ncbi:MAG: deoxyguanosinetriphosphate triphosphohydrolase [Alphaproteobacteria bacterium]|nr:deoxyguanosinetriphosphate triphosphohydrolase [Alphaproteobacteria bacterium]
MTHDLKPYATLAAGTRGRLLPEPASASRSEYQRDRDRIVHSGAFRKLRNKTQVFIESEGDFYRTRLTHSLEVAQIARSISRNLGIDEDLTEAIALAHDLGHTCFGHAGEYALQDMMQPYGGFDHNDQTFRILTKLEQRYAAFNGLNLTWETLEGIAKHNGPLLPGAAGKPLPVTIAAFQEKWDLELTGWPGLEAQVASMADDIAYNTHDVDDGIRAGFLRIDDMEEMPLFADELKIVRAKYPGVDAGRQVHEVVRQVIGAMATDLLETSRGLLAAAKPADAAAVRGAGRPLIACSPAMQEHFKTLRAYLMGHVYRHGKVNDMLTKAKALISGLFGLYMEQPEKGLPASWLEKVNAAKDNAGRARIIADYIAGMTDRYAITEYRRLIDKDMKI